MSWLYVLSVWLHIVAAGIWIGSMVFLGAAVAPVVRRPGREEIAPRLLEEIGLRYRAVGWLSLALLVLTGVLNLGFRGYGWNSLLDGSLWQGPFGRTLLVKLLLVVLMTAITLWHDVWVGPRATALLRAPDSNPGPEAHRRERERLRKLAAGIGWAMLLLSLAIALLGVLLARGGTIPPLRL